MIIIKDIADRIRLIRTQLLGKKLTRVKFGEMLGVSQNVIENLEYDRVEITDERIYLICKTFNIHEEWLRYGRGEIFVNTVEIAFSLLKKQFNLSDKDLIILEEFLNLTSKARKNIQDFIINTSEKMLPNTNVPNIKPHPTMSELEALNYKFNSAPISRVAAFGGGITEVSPPKKTIDLNKDFKE